MTNNPDYRKYLEEKFEGMAKLVNAQFSTVHDRLEAIEKQTTLTNGRVNILEDKVDNVEKDLLTHPINCNQGKKIESIQQKVDRLHDESIGKKAIAKNKIMTWENTFKFMGVIIAIGMLLIGYANLTKQNKSVETKVDNMGIPFVTNSRGEILALPDSTKIMYYPFDSLKYTIKRDK